MKKLVLLFSIICVLFTLTACGGEKVQETVSSGEISSIEKASGDEVSGDVVEANSTEEKVEGNPIASGEQVQIKESGEEKVEEVQENTTQNPVVTMTMNDGKVVKIELYPNIAPNTVNNFISLINKNFYDGVIFHRVIPGFMAQGGDPDGNGTGGPDYYIKGEFSSNNFKNDLKHDIGVISMARATPPDSAGSQFFICTGERAAALDGDYAAFGKVIEGMDNVMDIVNSPVGFSTNDLETAMTKAYAGKELTSNEIAIIQAYQAGVAFDRPVNPPKIKTMTVETFGVTYPEPEKVAKK